MTQTEFASTMHCINDHEFLGERDEKCPSCSEPSRELLDTVRRECRSALWWAIPYLVLPPIVGFVLAGAGWLTTTPQRALMTIVLSLFWLAGISRVVVVALGCLHPLIEARARVGTPPKSPARGV